MNSNREIDALLIYPKLGSMDSLVLDLPLSILYAASESVKRGYRIKTIDLRGEDHNWREIIQGYLDQGVLLAGVSVMTGSPLKYARNISEYIRVHSPSTKIVWGGPHATVVPETITQPFVDFLVRGYGSHALAELIDCLIHDGQGIESVPGLSFMDNGQPHHNVRPSSHEIIHYRDIPYDLLDINAPKYSRTYNGRRMFPIFSSIGCPYRCSFCIHPRVYKLINGPKWLPYPNDEILEHIEYIIERYKAKHFVFIDDTSFPDLKRMRLLFEDLIAKQLDITLEFRGARVNEIDRMDDSFLELMVKAGGRIMMVGVESGSDRILQKFQKGITKEQVIRINQRLANYPELTLYYNFIYGTPGETYDDLRETKDMVLQLLQENPNAYFGFGGDWKPIPGTKTLDIAEQEFGYKGPVSFDDWIAIDSSDSSTKVRHPWYTTKHNNLIKLMQVSSFVIDDKIIKESKGNNSMAFKLLRTMSRIYKPVAAFRLKNNLHHCMVEYKLWQFMLRQLPRLMAVLS